MQRTWSNTHQNLQASDDGITPAMRPDATGVHHMLGEGLHVCPSKVRELHKLKIRAETRRRVCVEADILRHVMIESRVGNEFLGNCTKPLRYARVVPCESKICGKIRMEVSRGILSRPSEVHVEEKHIQP